MLLPIIHVVIPFKKLIKLLLWPLHNDVVAVFQISTSVPVVRVNTVVAVQIWSTSFTVTVRLATAV